MKHSVAQLKLGYFNSTDLPVQSTNTLVNQWKSKV